MLKLVLLLTEIVFAACSSYCFFTGSAKPVHSSMNALIAYTFMISGLLLLITSLFAYKKYPWCSLVAWVTLFVTFLLGALFPRL